MANKRPQNASWKQRPAYRPLSQMAGRKPPRQVAQPSITDPWNSDPTYQNKIAQGQAARDMTKLGLATKQSQAEQAAGFQLKKNADGTYTADESAFASNPYTRAAMMKSAYDTQARRTMNSSAARGQLYSGAKDRAVKGDADAYTAQRSKAIQDMTALLVDIEQGGAQADQSFRDMQSNEQLAAIERAAKNVDASQFPAPTQLKSPKRYQYLINQLLKNAPAGKQRTQAIKSLIRQRNAAQEQLNNG